MHAIKWQLHHPAATLEPKSSPFATL